MTTQTKWRIWSEDGVWYVRRPGGPPLPFQNHASAVSFMTKTLGHEAKLKANPKVALAMLVLAGLAAAAKKGKAGK